MRKDLTVWFIVINIKKPIFNKCKKLIYFYTLNAALISFMYGNPLNIHILIHPNIKKMNQLSDCIFIMFLKKPYFLNYFYF